MSLLLVAVFAILVVAYAQDREDKLIPYKLLTTIDIPGGLTAFDISWVDSLTALASNNPASSER